MESFCVRSVRGFAKFLRDPYYEPTIVVHDNRTICMWIQKNNLYSHLKRLITNTTLCKNATLAASVNHRYDMYTYVRIDSLSIYTPNNHMCKHVWELTVPYTSKHSRGKTFAVFADFSKTRMFYH